MCAQINRGKSAFRSNSEYIMHIAVVIHSTPETPPWQDRRWITAQKHTRSAYIDAPVIYLR